MARDISSHILFLYLHQQLINHSKGDIIMANIFLQRLKANDKKGLFTSSQTPLMYSTGFLPLDYRNGYLLESKDESGKLIRTTPMTGIVSGSLNTIIGKSGVAKTTWCVQTAYNIVRQFDNSVIIHYDLEQSSSNSRIMNVTGATQTEMLNKYILRQEKNYLEDIWDSIYGIITERENNKEDYMYHSGILDEFGREIVSYVPTVIIIDSIPSLASNAGFKKESDEDKELSGNTDAMRMAQRLKKFYKMLLPVAMKYNIIVFAINHINQKIEINPMVHTQAQVMYLGMDEALPGGNAPIYYANNIFKFISKDKKNLADDGYDGFLVNVYLMKSRTNRANNSEFVTLAYEQLTGFNPVRTLQEYASANDIITGRNPYSYFMNEKDTVKFDTRKFMEAFHSEIKVRQLLMEKTQPYLMDMLGGVSDNEKMTSTEYFKLLQGVCDVA